jgi:hypothetical protein
MFNNQFVDYLIRHGWIEAGPMKYKKVNTGLMLLFDTSNQIEIENNDRRVGDFYLQDLNDLIRVLDSVQR